MALRHCSTVRTIISSPLYKTGCRRSASYTYVGFHNFLKWPLLSRISHATSSPLSAVTVTPLPRTEFHFV